MSDAANPAPEKSPSIADLLAQTLAAVENAPAEEKAEVLKEIAEDNIAAAKAAKAKAKAENAIKIPMIPTLMKYVFLTAIPHQVVCSKCDHAAVANEMITVKVLANGEPSFRHLRCMGVPIVK